MTGCQYCLARHLIDGLTNRILMTFFVGLWRNSSTGRNTHRRGGIYQFFSTIVQFFADHCMSLQKTDFEPVKCRGVVKTCLHLDPIQ